MKRRNALLLFCLAILGMSSGAWSKGQTLGIHIQGEGMAQAVEITDPGILSQFNIWNGPGVRSSGPDGIPHPPAHLDPARPEGRFIDWPRGKAEDRPSGLRRLEVTFIVGFPGEPEFTRGYVVAYEPEKSGETGYIYLPRWKNDLIHHHVEGNWIHASRRWNELVFPVISDHIAPSADLAGHPAKGCIVGRGSVAEDGAIEFVLIDDDGNRMSRWRYETTNPTYQSVRKHIGKVEPGREVDISCWPAKT